MRPAKNCLQSHQTLTPDRLVGFFARRRPRRSGRRADDADVEAVLRLLALMRAGEAAGVVAGDGDAGRGAAVHRVEHRSVRPVASLHGILLRVVGWKRS